MAVSVAPGAKMSVQYVNPFIESVYEFFNKMLDATASRGALSVGTGASAPRTMTAIIGLSGPIRGTVALSLPTETALAIVNRLLGTDSRLIDDTTADGVMEVVNIMAGGAKARLPQTEDPIRLSLPTVVRGGDFRVDHPSRSKWLDPVYE